MSTGSFVVILILYTSIPVKCNQSKVDQETVIIVAVIVISIVITVVAIVLILIILKLSIRKMLSSVLQLQKKTKPSRSRSSRLSSAVESEINTKSAIETIEEVHFEESMKLKSQKTEKSINDDYSKLRKQLHKSKGDATSSTQTQLTPSQQDSIHLSAMTSSLDTSKSYRTASVDELYRVVNVPDEVRQSVEVFKMSEASNKTGTGTGGSSPSCAKPERKVIFGANIVSIDRNKEINDTTPTHHNSTSVTSARRQLILNHSVKTTN